MTAREGLMKTATSGFTLVETLFVLLIISILTLMAGNAWHALQQRMEARAAVALIASSLYAARNAAITRQMPVSICGSRDGLACLLGATPTDRQMDLCNNMTSDTAAGVSDELVRKRLAVAAIAGVAFLCD